MANFLQDVHPSEATFFKFVFNLGLCHSNGGDKIQLENRNSINTIHLWSPIHVLIMHIHKVSLGKLDLQD